MKMLAPKTNHGSGVENGRKFKVKNYTALLKY
jgi:hypothetical protein